MIAAGGGYRAPVTGGGEFVRRDAVSFAGSTSLARASRVMAAGTLTSRVTGFVRTAVLAAALGVAGLGDAYAVANTIPNILFDLLLGGVLGAIVVPVLLDAAARRTDHGQGYARSLLTLTALGLGGVSVVAVVLAPRLVDVYLGPVPAAEHRLAVLFARLFLPQVVCYGLGAVAGAVLNARGRFAAPMWAPVLNNVLVIAAGLVFLEVSTGHRLEPGSITGAAVWLIGVGTTLGIVVQTAALLPALRRAGLPLRPRLHFAELELGRLGRLAGWVLGYVVTNQLGLWVTIRLANTTAAGHPGVGYASYSYAYALFLVPYAVVAIPVLTALLPRMSVARIADVRAQLSAGVRVIGVLLVPAAVLGAVVGPSLAVVVFGHGRTTPGQAWTIGLVFSAFCLGLVPFAGFQLQVRAFYARRDTRTPALVNLGATAVNVAVDLAVFLLLSGRARLVGLALGYASSYVVAWAVSTPLLSAQLGGLDGRVVRRTFARAGFAAVLAAAVAGTVAAVLHPTASPARALVVLVVGGGGGAVVCALAARRMRLLPLGRS